MAYRTFFFSNFQYLYYRSLVGDDIQKSPNRLAFVSAQKSKLQFIRRIFIKKVAQLLVVCGIGFLYKRKLKGLFQPNFNYKPSILNGQCPIHNVTHKFDLINNLEAIHTFSQEYKCLILDPICFPALEIHKVFGKGTQIVINQFLKL